MDNAMFGNNSDNIRKISQSMDVFRIPAGVLTKALDACRGKRNLADNLTQLIFSKDRKRKQLPKNF